MTWFSIFTIEPWSMSSHAPLTAFSVAMGVRARWHSMARVMGSNHFWWPRIQAAPTCIAKRIRRMAFNFSPYVLCILAMMRNLSLWPMSLQTIQGPWKTFEGWWISDRWFLPDSPLSSCPSCTGQEYPTRQLVEQLSCWLRSDLTTSLGECGLQTCIRGFQVELIRRSIHILAESK